MEYKLVDDSKFAQKRYAECRSFHKHFVTQLLMLRYKLESYIT